MKKVFLVFVVLASLSAGAQTNLYSTADRVLTLVEAAFERPAGSLKYSTNLEKMFMIPPSRLGFILGEAFHRDPRNLGLEIQAYCPNATAICIARLIHSLPVPL